MRRTQPVRNMEPMAATSRPPVGCCVFVSSSSGKGQASVGLGYAAIASGFRAEAGFEAFADDPSDDRAPKPASVTRKVSFARSA